jgi:hypothetical protein
MYYSVSDQYMSKIFNELLKKVHLNGDANARRLNTNTFIEICCLRDLVQVSEDYSNVWSMSTEQMLTNVVHND